MQWPPPVQSTNRRFDRIHLERAYRYAWKHSTDASTKNGARILSRPQNYLLSEGTNHLPSDARTPKTKKEKYELTVHAEEDAINNAGAHSLEGTLMVMPWLPCSDCAQLIADAGIQELVGHYDMVARTPRDWREDISYGVEILDCAEIDIKLYSGTIGGVKSLMRKEVWRP